MSGELDFRFDRNPLWDKFDRYPMEDFHDFLFHMNGDLYEDRIDIIIETRRKIDGMYDTAQRFKRADICGKSQHDDIVFEFCGTWRYPAELFTYSPSKSYQFVNPSYEHAPANSDVYSICACGNHPVIQVVNDSGNHVATGIGEHSELCKPYHRYRAFADLQELREKVLIRCMKLGWSGVDVMPRLGYAHKMSAGAISKGCHLDLWDLQEEYRRLAGNTYIKLVYEYDVHASVVSELYDKDKSTLRRYYNQYGDYKSEELTH